MPQIKRTLTETSPVSRPTRRHLWRGSGIAKFIGEEDEALRFFQSGLEFVITFSKNQYILGEEVTVTVAYSNQRAGHNIPTGDPERFIIIFFRLINEKGTIIHQEYIRIGQVWEWVPKPKKISDNSMKPLERRTIDINFKLPEKINRYFFTVVVENNRLKEQYAKDMNLIGRYPLKAEVKRLSIPIKLLITK
jgi:hypothetical protein